MNVRKNTLNGLLACLLFLLRITIQQKFYLMQIELRIFDRMVSLNFVFVTKKCRIYIENDIIFENFYLEFLCKKKSRES